MRKGDKPEDDLVILINFDVNAREGFRFGLPREGVYQEIFNSDDEVFGGSGVSNKGRIETKPGSWNGRSSSIVIRVPPLAGIVFKRVGDLKKKPAKKDETAKQATATKPAATAAKGTATKTKASAKPATTAKKQGGAAEKKQTANKTTTNATASTK